MKKDLQNMGEFGLIRRIRKWVEVSNPSLIRGIGDDVAVMEMGRKVLLATTDILIEGIHFDLSWIDPFHLGKKSLLVNLSDIAAMGGRPTYFLISLGIPKNLPLSFVYRFYHGLKEAAKQHRVDLVGGDTSLSRKVIVNICLLGEGLKGQVLFRSGAKVGDFLFVSGTLGDSSLGLRILQKKGRRGGSKALIQRHLCPIPRTGLGQAIAKKRLATSMIDVSDGLLIDTSHLLEENRVGARIWTGSIPLSKPYNKLIRFYSKDPYEFALRGGEDYELLFTAPPKMKGRLSFLGASLKIPVTAIGEILPRGKGLSIMREDGTEYSPSQLGFDHFK